MAHDLNPTPGSDFGSLAIPDLPPERPALIGEFSPAYEAFREAIKSGSQWKPSSRKAKMARLEGYSTISNTLPVYLKPSGKIMFSQPVIG